MTFAEVIDTLQTWIEKADDEYDREEMGRVAGLKDALHEIKKIELCKDAISRQAAINIVVCDILSSAVVYGRTEEGMSARKAIVDCLKRLPPVTPAEKVGQWIIYDVHGHTACKCSECGMDVGYPCDDKFCKHCGAKMQEVEDAD